MSRNKYITLEPCIYPSLSDYNVVELKYDGWFTTLILKGHRWELYSRTDRLLDEGTLVERVPYTVLQGEYLFGTEWAKDRGEGYKSIVVFDAECINREDMTEITYEDKRKLIKKFIDDTFKSARILGGVRLIDSVDIMDAPALWQEKVIKGGFEGLVFKHTDRSSQEPFARMKRAVDMDYVCMGFEESTSDTYEGWGVACVYGGLYVKGELTRVCKVSGLTNDIRKEFYDHPERYIGQVFEAQGKKITKKGALRHPNFIRWREDKVPEDCIKV